MFFIVLSLFFAVFGIYEIVLGISGCIKKAKENENDNDNDSTDRWYLIVHIHSHVLLLLVEEMLILAPTARSSTVYYNVSMDKNELLFNEEYESFYKMTQGSDAFRRFCAEAFGEDFSQDGFSDIKQIE